MFLVVGLGNPGLQHLDTRHNVGFLVVDAVARRYGVDLSREEHGSKTGKALIGSTAVRFAKPQGYMNRSGVSVNRLLSFYKVPHERLLVIHDDLETPFGTLRLKRGGGHGGHNGLRDIQQKTGSRDYPRLRVGISRPPKGWDVSNYVLGRWTREESQRLPDVIADAVDRVEAVVREGFDAASSSYSTPAASRSAGSIFSGGVG